MSEISEIELKKLTKDQCYIRGYADGNADGKKNMFDKIRNDIEKCCNITNHQLITITTVLRIIDKYKNDNNIDDIHKWNILSFIRKDIPLDNLRAEIINKSNEPNYLHENEDWSVGLEMALEIIDKYREEV